MAFSYSFHLSSKSHAVTSCGKVSQVGKHNLREYESANYDRSKIDVLIGQGSMLDMVKECYHQQFDEALAEYNQGKRADRQIHDYLEHVDRSRNDVAVEVIIQIGDKEFWKTKTDAEWQSMKEVFREQLRTLHRECPDFKIVSAVAHYDESSPHIHVVGVPVARGYKKGMAVQCAKTKIFTQETLTHLQDVMRADAEKYVSSMPLFRGMELKAKEKGRNKDIPKQSLTEFYELENQISRLDEDVKAKAQQIEKQESTIKANNSTLSSQARQIDEKKAEISRLETSEKFKQSHISKLDEDITRLDDAIETMEQKKKDLESILTVLKSNMDNFFMSVISKFKGGLSEAREIALQGTEPDTFTKAMEMINNTEERAIKSIDTIDSDRPDRVSVRAKLEENKQKVKETIREESSAEKEEIQQIYSRRRGR